ncbi:MAG: helix-turn-helix domain-containing protein, partial [Kiritimatiellae bacterium]|nr:helix-turn-helix domain-containing protein [Kiritimatiellia bacterium]
YSISEAAQMYGLSRPSFYKARDRFEKEGIAGLLPRKRGPRSAHKLTADILRFVTEQIEVQSGETCWKDLSRMIEEQFSKKIHPRSIERSIKQRKKGA